MQNLTSLFRIDKKDSFSASSALALLAVFQHSRQWSTSWELMMEGNPSLLQRSHLYRLVFRFMSWYRMEHPLSARRFLWWCLQGPCHTSRLYSWHQPRSACSWASGFVVLKHKLTAFLDDLKGLHDFLLFHRYRLLSLTASKPLSMAVFRVMSKNMNVNISLILCFQIVSI